MERQTYETPTLELLCVDGDIRTELTAFSVKTPGGETVGGGQVIPAPSTGSSSDFNWDPGSWGGD